jgi:putative acetyltransferase
VSLRITEGGLDDGQVIAMLKFHFETNISVTPKGSAHVFDLSRLKAPDISFWSAWDGDTLVGVGALKRINASDGEIKSMHTLKTARRSGVGAAMLQHIVAEARKMGLTRLLLERIFRFLRTGPGALRAPRFYGMRAVRGLQTGPQQHLHDARILTTAASCRR